MKEQDVTFSFSKKLTITFLSIAYVVLTASAQANQSVLLDANGVPLSDEVLLLLSTGSSKLLSNDGKSVKPNKANQEIADAKIGKSQLKKIKRAKRPANPLLEEELLNALKAGKIPRVKQLLAAGVAPTYKNYKGETPLGIAVSRGWASMVISLIENGANINEKGARGVTLLHVASAKGMTDVAKVLVKGGLSPSKKTDKNWTPLHIAARYNHWKLVQYFVSVGVDPDIRNSDGQTALGLARHLRHQGIIKILSRVTRRSSLDFTETNLLKKKSKSKKRKKKRKS